MEKALIKMARQLRGLDEASLMSMWEKYAQVVRDFEPSERWEEAVLVLSFIQSVRFKNQLFNHQWAGSLRPHPASSAGPGEAAHASKASIPGRPLPASGASAFPAGSSQGNGGRAGSVAGAVPGAGHIAGRGAGSEPALGHGAGKRGKLIRFRARDEA